MARAGTGLFSKVYKPETGTPTNTAHTQTKESKGSPPPHTLQMGKQGCLSTAGNLHKKRDERGIKQGKLSTGQMKVII